MKRFLALSFSDVVLIMLINVKMPYEQEKFRAQLTWVRKIFMTSGPALFVWIYPLSKVFLIWLWYAFLFKNQWGAAGSQDWMVLYVFTVCFCVKLLKTDWFLVRVFLWQIMKIWLVLGAFFIDRSWKLTGILMENWLVLVWSHVPSWKAEELSWKKMCFHDLSWKADWYSPCFSG